LSGAPPQVQRLLRACLEKEPKSCLRDARDAFRLLETPPQETLRQETSPASGRRALLLWNAAAMLAIVAAVASWMAYRATRPQEKLAVRLGIDLGPDRTVRAGLEPDVILSPDGTRLAYLSQDRLFTRRLDQSQGTELSGTQGAASPFFSPDGQWIAFAAGGKLKKISIARCGPSPVTRFAGRRWPACRSCQCLFGRA
jgi:serine/threonine-protein kinase